MKLLKRDRAALARVLEKLERGQAFILNSQTIVARRKSVATTTLDMGNAQGDVCQAIDKEIGSELALLHTAISQLRAYLDEKPLGQAECEQ